MKSGYLILKPENELGVEIEDNNITGYQTWFVFSSPVLQGEKARVRAPRQRAMPQLGESRWLSS